MHTPSQPTIRSRGRQLTGSQSAGIKAAGPQRPKHPRPGRVSLPRLCLGLISGVLISGWLLAADAENQDPAAQTDSADAVTPAEDAAPEATPTSSTGPDPVERLLPNPGQQQLAQLAKAQSPETEVIWLETQNEAFLGLYQPANTGTPLGGAVLLHDDRTSPDWPQTIRALRTGLPDQGWYTLAIAVTDEPMPSLPQRAPDGEADGPQPTIAAPDYQAFAEQLFERIEVALRHLEAQQAERLLIVGVGTGGYWATRFAAQAGPQRALMLTLIDAQPPRAQLQPPFDTLLAGLEIPTLDLFHAAARSQGSIERHARSRLLEARRQQRQQYLQRRLPPRSGPDELPDRRLLHSFRGLFQQHLLERQQAPPVIAGSDNGERPPGR